MECAPKNPGDIGIHCGGRTLEGEARHCTGGVTADARKLTQLIRVGRDESPAIFNYILCEQVQVGGPAIISQSIPALPDTGRRCRSQGFHSWIPLEKSTIVALHPGHLGLLEHEL